MEEKIYQKLLEALGKTSLTERTIKEKATRMAKRITTEEAINEDVIADAVGDLKSFEGELNFKVASRVEEALKNKTPRPVSPEKMPDISQDLLGLKDKIKELEDFKANYENSQSVLSQQTMREKLAENIKKALIDSNGCEDNVYLELALSKINFDNDEVTNIENLKKIYDDRISLDAQKGGYIPSISMDIPSVPKTAEQIKKEDEELTKKLKAEGKL